jgi:hypothetical protein
MQEREKILSRKKKKTSPAARTVQVSLDRADAIIEGGPGYRIGGWRRDGLLGRFRACPPPSTVLLLFNILKLGNLHYPIRKHHSDLEFSPHRANVVPQSRHVHVGAPFQPRNGGWDRL